jgi:hypothetical protein
MPNNVNERKGSSAQKHASFQLRLQTALQTQSKVLEAAVRAVQESQKRSGDQIARILAVLDKQMRIASGRVAEELKEVPGKTRAALRTIGEHGWYLDMKMSVNQLATLAEAFRRGNVDEVEKALVLHYRRRVAAIAADLARWCPGRQKILAGAFDAHRRGEYDLSIPILLIQADGICQDFLGVQLYSRRAGRPVTAQAIAERGLTHDSFEAAFLHLFELALPISASAGKWPSQRSAAFNRHSILHGESVDYGTEINGLKTISLIYYVASALRHPEGTTPN